MKKTSGILLTLLSSSQFAFATTFKIDGSRIDAVSGDSISSYKLSSIYKVIKFADGNYRVFIGGSSKFDTYYNIKDKEIYEKIMDYMEDSK